VPRLETRGSDARAFGSHEAERRTWWSLSADHVARLDAVSVTTLAYPYWHQRGFRDRNPPPV